MNSPAQSSHHGRAARSAYSPSPEQRRSITGLTDISSWEADSPSIITSVASDISSWEANSPSVTSGISTREVEADSPLIHVEENGPRLRPKQLLTLNVSARVKQQESCFIMTT